MSPGAESKLRKAMRLVKERGGAGGGHYERALDLEASGLAGEHKTQVGHAISQGGENRERGAHKAQASLGLG
jgi:hypothetical protein